MVRIGIDCVINICMLKDQYTNHLASPSNRQLIEKEYFSPVIQRESEL